MHRDRRRNTKSRWTSGPAIKGQLSKHRVSLLYGASLMNPFLVHTLIYFDQVPNSLERLEALELSTLSSFIYDISKNLFYKIVNNSKHPLHDRIKVNPNRTSSHKPTVFYPPRAKTTKCATPSFLILWHSNLRCILFTYSVFLCLLFLL